MKFLNLDLPIGRSPIVQTVALRLARPSLSDNTADLDRLLRSLDRHGFGYVSYDPSRMNHLAWRLRQGAFQVTAVLGHYQSHWELIEVHPGFKEFACLGVAIDLGSSRLAIYLVDMLGGKILAQTSVANPQIQYGEDIISRIIFARQEENLKLLQSILIESLNLAIGRLLDETGHRVEDVYALSVAGNTTMSHFLLGIDPANICKEPYIPVANRFPVFHAAQLGFAAHPSALVFVFPNIGSYFGGDLIADILATGIHRSEALSMLVDVGTNAEVVLGNKDWLVGCAGAAGPALEGGVVERGMMAMPGAIDRVRINRRSLEPTCHVLGETKPVGICGSGLIDLIAEMFMSGLLTVQGKINTSARSSRIVTTPDGLAYLLVLGKDAADGKDLMISEIDIGIFLKSKAAMYTILNVITRKVGVSFEDLRHFYVTGTFGNYIDPRMAVIIGMLPDLPISTFKNVRDAVGCGAVMVLLDRSLIAETVRICSMLTYVELNVNLELMNEFRGALFLPHTNRNLFPSVCVPSPDCFREDESAIQKVSEEVN